MIKPPVGDVDYPKLFGQRKKASLVGNIRF